MINRPVDQVFPRFGVSRYKQILMDCLAMGQVRFCSGMMHSAFILPDDSPQQDHIRQNLQIRRLGGNDEFYILLQITDISDHFQRVSHLRHLIKGLGADYEQAKTAGENMQQQAYFDHLTGVYNRNYFMHQLRHDIMQAERVKEKLTVLFLDIDGFKAVNDNYGHSIGDLLLQHVATRLKASVRRSDTVARFGGDEFAVILTNTHQRTDGLGVAEKIRQALLVPFELDGNMVSISASIGCSLYPEDSGDPQALIDMADRAMYQVKFSGKNNVMFFKIP